MDHLTFLNFILPLATSWASAKEESILTAGIPLTPMQAHLATRVGLKQPARVRLLKVKSIPVPNDPVLRQAGMQTGFLVETAAALSLRYGIFLTQECWSDRSCLIHELTHTLQYERFGSIEEFLRQYFTEVLTVGYSESPLERECNEMARRLLTV